jgi:hypothetical protein
MLLVSYLKLRLSKEKDESEELKKDTVIDFILPQFLVE